MALLRAVNFGVIFLLLAARGKRTEGEHARMADCKRQVVLERVPPRPGPPPVPARLPRVGLRQRQMCAFIEQRALNPRGQGIIAYAVSVFMTIQRQLQLQILWQLQVEAATLLCSMAHRDVQRIPAPLRPLSSLNVAEYLRRAQYCGSS